MATALIDGDIILYEAGFSAQRTYYEVSNEEGEVIGSFDRAADAKTFINMQDFECTRTKYVDPNCPDYVWKGNANSLLSGIMDGSDCDDAVIALTGKGNYRETLAPHYKQNRSGSDKPIMYTAMKQWLIDRHGAVVIDGMEADDYLAMNGYNNPDAVICTKDKDLLMVAGTHYNWGKDSYFVVTEEEGNRWFFKQLLMGDPTDNIIGLKGIGDKTADKLLNGLETPQEMYELCVEKYLDKGRTLEELNINGTLLWMMRHEESTWMGDLNIEEIVDARD